MRTKIKQIKKNTSTVLGTKVTVKGWVRTVRDQKTFAFVEVNDGSTLSNLQVVAPAEIPHFTETICRLATGCSVSITGKVVQNPSKENEVEVHAEDITIVGTCDPTTYPLQKKRHTFEFLRTIAHLRPRTNTLGAVMRIRNALAYASHRFFQERGFLYIHTPIITGSDCEGAGKMFQVTTLNVESPPKTQENKIDYSQDFFKRSCFLTVSGQLEGEVYACSLSDIYTFGPTFRAENSNTSRHLAEFWMIEPEMAFADLNDNMDCVEAYLKYVLGYVLEHCSEDMNFFEKHIAPGSIEKLRKIVETPFERATYTYVIRVLEKAPKSFEFPVKWGADLQSEHERYLAEEFFNKPVIVTDYPKQIKAFYMRENTDNKTVAAMDVLVPGVGEIVGGSQREERLDYLEHKIKEVGLSPNDYWWYLELRKYGTVPHAGFGVGFERLMLFITGMENIRDVIPFPRFPGSAEF